MKIFRTALRVAAASIALALVSSPAFAAKLGDIKSDLEKTRINRPEATQAAGRAPAAQTKDGAETPRELLDAVRRLYSNPGDAELDGIIEKLKAVQSAAADAKTRNRAALELSQAYIMKKEYAVAIGLLEGLSKEKDLEYPEKVSGNLALARQLYKKDAATDKLMSSVKEYIAAKKAFEEAVQKRSPDQAKLRKNFIAASEKYRKALADHQSISGNNPVLTYLGYQAGRIVNRERVNMDDPYLKAVMNEKDREWADVQRSAAILEKKGMKWTISNVRWGFGGVKDLRAEDPLWRDATIDINKIKEVYFCLKPFPPEWVTAHAFLLFEFADDEAVVTNKAEKTDGLVFSVEPKYVKGLTYGHKHGKPPFFIVYQFSSKKEYLELAAIVKSRIIYSHRLKLTDKQKRNLLMHSMITSYSNAELSNKYDLLENNCINNLFMVIDKILPGQNYSKKVGMFFNPAVSTPQLCINSLTRDGLLTGSSAPMNLYVFRPDNERPSDAKKIEEVEAKIGNARKVFLTKITSGSLDSDKIKKLFYDEFTESLSYFYIPGTEPLGEGSGGFNVEGDLLKKIENAGDKTELMSVMAQVFDSYSAAANRRMKMKGPEISGFLKKNLDSMVAAAGKK